MLSEEREVDLGSVSVGHQALGNLAGEGVLEARGWGGGGGADGEDDVGGKVGEVAQVPAPWVAVMSEVANRPFYFNEETKIGTFDPPFDPPFDRLPLHPSLARKRRRPSQEERVREASQEERVREASRLSSTVHASSGVADDRGVLTLTAAPNDAMPAKSGDFSIEKSESRERNTNKGEGKGARDPHGEGHAHLEGGVAESIPVIEVEEEDNGLRLAGVRTHRHRRTHTHAHSHTQVHSMSRDESCAKSETTERHESSDLTPLQAKGRLENHSRDTFGSRPSSRPTHMEVAEERAMHSSIDNGGEKWKEGVRGGPGAVTWDGFLSRGGRSADEVERISDSESEEDEFRHQVVCIDD